jgi:enoyl-CoA hydratase/carnithine racemase
MPISFTTTITDRIAEIVFDVAPVNAFDSETWMSLPAIITAAASNPGSQLCADPRGRRIARVLRRG